MNLKELARHLGLSPTTVSRALNGYADVSEATRQRVIEAARRHNYRPNSRARSLATGRAMTIGHVLPASTRHEMVNPVFADFLAGAADSYRAAGFDIKLTMVDDADIPQLYRALSDSGAVDGFVVHGPRAADRRVEILHKLGTPFVVHGRATGSAVPYAWLDMNNRSAFRRATDLLLDLGHRRIGLLNGFEWMDFAIRRRTGFTEALEARGLSVDPALMFAGEMTEANGHAATAAMLALPDPPSALITSSIILALGARRAAWEAGLTPGRELSIVTHDDVLSYIANAGRVPPFTAIRSSVREAGRLTAEMLLDMIANPGAPPPTRLLDAELILGRSTGPAPDRRSAA